jgi:hypothetical protein
LEVWEKVFLKDADFVESTHGKVGCVICHGGDSSLEDKDLAHEGMVIDPSNISCVSCHSEISDMNDLCLHATLDGFKSVLEARGGDLSEGSQLATAFENHCQQCHTTCGQCHISRPDETDGGFISSHEIRLTPSTQNNCVACHGSRVGDEYLGQNEGFPADVHWTQETMTCTECHGAELHGSEYASETRYDNPYLVKCEDCHEEIFDNTDDNPMHAQHLVDLQCQVCHSVEYKNCYSCHVSIDAAGLPCRTSDPSVMDFKIGYNPIISDQIPYKYVVLRHVPTCTGTCDYYGSNLLPNFSALPTWKYATPHNTQLHTPQNESCNACHGNGDLYLTESDVKEDELEANKGVIVEEIPSLVDE